MGRNNIKKDYINNYSFKICFLLLGFLSFPVILTSFLFLFKLNVSSVTFFLSIAFLLYIYYKLFYKKSSKKEFFLPLIISFFIIIVSILISMFLCDNSWDSWSYHLPAVIKLKNGWNPIYQHFDNEKIIKIWAEHYPKFIWIYGANLYKITNNFFAGTSFNTIICFSTFFLAYDILKKMFSRTISSILALIIGFNVISLGQMFTMYNDGVFGLSIISSLLIYYAINKKIYVLENNYALILILSFYLSILANIKFNGALYAFIIFVIFSLCFLIRKKLRFNKFFFKYVSTIGIIVMIVAVNTYLPNYIFHKNIGYPIIGDNKVEIIEQAIPSYINKDDSKISSFIKMITLKYDSKKYTYNPFFVVNKEDFICSASTDCRSNGFGGYYQSILLLSLIVFLCSCVRYAKNNKFSIFKIEFYKNILEEYSSEFLFLLTLLLFFIFTPATWWPRYIPYMYLIPLFIVIFFNNEWHLCKLNSICSYLIILLYLLSLIIITPYRIKTSYNFTNSFNNDLNELVKESKNKVIDVSTFNYENNYYKVYVRKEILRKNKIKYIEHDLDECEIIKMYGAIGSMNLLNCENGD